MKSSRQQRRKSGTSSVSKMSQACTRKRETKKRNSGLCSKTTGQALGPQLPLKELSPQHMEQKAPVFNFEHGQSLQPSSKIKLQLFPMDEGTRVGLEKDGHNPHLELSLSARKKISSVLKHLNNKWGSSSIAVGELILFPYNIQLENLAGYRRWTLNDSGTSAADVYKAVESPDVFRLRYGWFSDGVPTVYTRSEPCSKLENIKKGPCENFNIIHGEKQQVEVTSQEYQPIKSNNMHSVLMGESKPIGNEPVDDLRGDKCLTLSSAMWADSFTNISIGGLLSEASLQGKPSHCDTLPTGSHSGLQQIPFSFDSFDAAIAAHIHGLAHGPSSCSLGSQSSILDAEDTCHAFAFKKVSAQAGPANDNACQESKADLPPHLQGVDNNENSLGLSSINWIQFDSLGAPDLGLSSSQQIINGDTISLGSLLGSSLDALQSSSFLFKDKSVPPAST